MCHVLLVVQLCVLAFPLADGCKQLLNYISKNLKRPIKGIGKHCVNLCSFAEHCARCALLRIVPSLQLCEARWLSFNDIPNI
jgi:hypothetical protein